MASEAELLHYEVLVGRCSLVLGFLHAGFFLFPPGAGGAGRRFWPFAPPRWSIVAPRGLAVG